jgi:hypothetical protein
VYVIPISIIIYKIAKHLILRTNLLHLGKTRM